MLLSRTDFCCKYCKNITKERFNKCSICGEFSSLDGEYYWIKQNRSKDELRKFVVQHPSYQKCYCRICKGNGLLTHCWNH